MDDLKAMQLRFRTIMKRLGEIRNLDSKDLNDKIREERDGLLAEVEDLKSEIDTEHLRIHQELGRIDGDGGVDPNGGDPMAGGRLYDTRTLDHGQPYTLKGPKENKSFRSLFGETPRNNVEWTDQESNFFAAVFSKRFHPGLVTRAMNEGIGSEGGFLVPTEVSSLIHDVSLEDEIVLPRAFVHPMQSNDLDVPAMDIGDHSSNLYGGFVASRVAEAGTLSQANPKARMVSLKATKLYGFLKLSNELATDAVGGLPRIIDICGKGLGWYRDKEFLKGTGAGQPLGIMNADCTIEVPKEIGQPAATIWYENLTNLMARMWAGSFKNSVWICHQSTIPQLLTLTVDIGTGGSFIKVMSETDGKFTMLTRPVIFTEKTETLGTAGDIMLVDISQYLIGMREEMRFDTSQHLYFDTDEIACRLITRNDAAPLWDESLTLEDGTTTVSPFVTLEAR